MDIPTPYQETFRQNPSRKIAFTLDLAATLNSWSVLKLNHNSTTPRLATATHVGTDGYPQKPCHTTTLPYRILPTLVRLSLRTKTAIHQVQHVYDNRVCGLLGAGETGFPCDEHVNLVA